jgi:recombination protein RecT
MGRPAGALLTMTAIAPAVPAASVILLRDDPFEVLMLERNPDRSFAPGAWVFPGGIVDPADEVLGNGDELAWMRAAALRETFEETGIWLGTPFVDSEVRRTALLNGVTTLAALLGESPVDWESLVWTSRWITPKGAPKRFDTWFFLARVGRDAIATAEASEAVGLEWVHPSDALARQASGSMKMIFPTIRNLEAIAGFRSSSELLASRRGAVIEAVEPVLVNGRPTLP